MTSIQYDVLSKPLHYNPPFQNQSFQKRKSYLVKLSNNKKIGVGEAAPLGDWTESNNECKRALQHQTPENMSDVKQIMDSLDQKPAARFAINQAKLDLQSKLEERPLYHTLRDTDQGSSELKINSLLHLSDLPKYNRKKTKKLNFDTIKIKTSSGPEKTICELLNTKQITNSNQSIRIDPNASWTEEQLKRCIEKFKKIKLEYLEQPLGVDQLTDHTKINQQIPIALDESFQKYGLEYIYNSADFVVIKPMFLGGLDRAIEVIRESLRSNVKPVITGTLAGLVSRLGTTHLAYAWRSQLPACGLSGSEFIRNDSKWDQYFQKNDTITLHHRYGQAIPDTELIDYK